MHCAVCALTCELITNINRYTDDQDSFMSHVYSLNHAKVQTIIYQILHLRISVHTPVRVYDLQEPLLF